MTVMFSVERLFVLVTLLASSSLAEEYRWRRAITSYQTVTESVSVDKEGKTVTMYADSKDLDKTPFHKSVSFHDFQPKKPLEEGSLGLVALSTDNACFVTNVAKSFEEVVREASSRNNQRVAKLDSPSHRYQVDTKFDLSAYSASAARFCGNKPAFQLKAVKFESPFDKFWPWPYWVLCFWWPYPIDLTMEAVKVVAPF